MALEKHLLPIIFGDCSIDSAVGGTILSTEEQMSYLVPMLKPPESYGRLEPEGLERLPTCQL
jgi:isopentenyl phosphate kinase